MTSYLIHISWFNSHNYTVGIINSSRPRTMSYYLVVPGTWSSIEFVGSAQRTQGAMFQAGMEIVNGFCAFVATYSAKKNCIFIR